MSAQPKLPNGPTGFASIQATLAFVKKQYHGLHEFMRPYAGRRGVAAGKIRGNWTTVLYNPDYASQVLDQTDNDRKSFHSPYGKSPLTKLFEGVMPGALILQDGETWWKERQLLNPYFHMSFLKQFVPHLVKVYEDQIQEWDLSNGKKILINPESQRTILKFLKIVTFDVGVADEEFTVFPQVMQMAYGILIGRTMLRIPIGVYHLPDWILSLIPIPALRRHLKNGKKFDQLNGKSLEIAEFAVNERAAQTDKKTTEVEGHGKVVGDMLDKMVEIHKKDQTKMPLKKISGNVVMTLFGGLETTYNVLIWVLYELSQPQNKHIRDKVMVEIRQLNGQPIGGEDFRRFPYLRDVIKEALRFYSPVYGIRRESRHALVLDSNHPEGGIQIPDHSMIEIPVYDIHHHPGWGDPEKFRPERFSDDTYKAIAHYFMGWGGGPHICLGAQLSELEIAVAVVTTLQKYPDILVEQQTPGDSALVKGTVVNTAVPMVAYVP